MNKNILLGAILSLALFAGLTSCEEERTVYNGPQYIMFADTLSVLGVENSEEYFDIRIAATKAVEKDYTLAVEVIDSSAVEGVHYTIESNTVTIKAGQLATSVRIRANYESLAIGEDPVAFRLRLVTDEETHWNLYGDKGLETKVMLQKICPFDVNAFSGYAMVTSTFLYDYVGSYNRLIKTEVDPTKKNTIILRDYLYDGYDVKVRFTTDDMLNPLIEMDDQPMASTGEAFGTIYGDGMLHIYQPSSMVSYYSSCEKFILQYMTVWVPGMAAGTNTVGTFINAVEWISDDEARILKGQGY
ncbi:MAG: DUF4984 domain-containing protein [Bacteroidaceae bacterium]|nr:DUF4984 domain-containing protein [Bacteroidaceae bacterium]